MFINYEEDSMGSHDEEEQRPLTTADIRALLDELMEEQEARHKEEIKLQDARHKEDMQQEIKLQEERINARHKEEMHALLGEQEERINASHQEEMRALEEATDRRLNDLELASSSRPQDATNNNFTNNRRSFNSQPVPNRQRRGNAMRFSLLMFRTRKNDRTNDDNDNDEGDDEDGSPRSERLEEDTFSLMMKNKPFREIPHCHPTLVRMIFVVGLLAHMILLTEFFVRMGNSLVFRNQALWWSLFVTSWVILLGPLSRPWLFSMFTFAALQLGLGLMIVGDQTFLERMSSGCVFNGETCIFLHVPIGSTKIFTCVQYLTFCFALVTQNDLFTSLQTLSNLWNADNVPWDEVIGQKGNRTWQLWACRILLPSVFKFFQAVMTLLASFIVIIQSTTIVVMLKDFTALFVLSEADNIMFHVADLGYFGDDLMKKTEEVKAVRWTIVEEEREEGRDVDEGEEKKCHRRWCNCSMSSCVFFTLWLVMIVALTYVVSGQYNGKYLEKKYPQCNAPRPQEIGDGYCKDFPPYNTAECGWDGGDCPKPTVVNGYINCTVSYPKKIGNKKCEDWPPYNTEDCGFDGGDCLLYKVVVDGYSDCLVGHPEWIRDWRCHDFAPYNTPECGHDGGRCKKP